MKNDGVLQNRVPLSKVRWTWQSASTKCSLRECTSPPLKCQSTVAIFENDEKGKIIDSPNCSGIDEQESSVHPS
jgi:hypothetical protein